MRAGARAAACTAADHLVIGKMPFSHRLTAYTLTTFLNVRKLSRLNCDLFFFSQNVEIRVERVAD